METLAHSPLPDLEIEAPQDRPQILIVDDDKGVRRLLGRLLGKNIGTCTLAADAREARRALQEQIFDLILCDMKMPGESGLDLLRHSAKEFPDSAFIVVTAVDDPAIAEEALRLGAYGYVIKPFKNNELVINVGNVMHRSKLEIKERHYRRDLEKIVQERTETMVTTLSNLQKAMKGIVEAMGLTIETRDPYTAGHQRRVAELALAIAREMNLSDKQCEGMQMAGIIHDIGKIAVPAEILAKPTRLTEPEFTIIKTHPEVGYNILKNIEFPWPIAAIVHQHHERLNGRGYPQGLSGDDILVESRIIAVADVVEAMASHRPYRPALGIDAALQEIEKTAGVMYDVDAVHACLTLFKENRFEFNHR
jgi:putative nucleotidyltransferase with HDIG domain